MRSTVVVPLVARERTLGVLTLMLGPGTRRFTAGDVRLAEELARRMALSVDNAQLFQEAQEAIRARDDFLSVASHELKTPLTPLHLKLQMLQREARAGGAIPAERVAATAAAADAQVRKLASLTAELLDVARIRAGRLQLSLEEVDLVALAREVVARHQPQAAQAGCTVEVDGPPSLTGTWDRMRLDQVVTNLLTNALKYGAGRPVSVRVEAVDGRARLSVQDAGIGVAPEDQARIFGRFERAVSERHYGGLGLGLFIARQIAEALGGSLQVSSVPGQGATFTVDLPPRAVISSVPAL
jgi:signal transduction histidine kinase